MPPCGKGIYIRLEHLIFIIVYIVQLYKEDWTILHMLGCQAITHPSTKQIIGHLNKYLGCSDLCLKIYLELYVHTMNSRKFSLCLMGL